ncbi:MAG: rod shape-determining protein MreC [Candidatus Latescibacteria bacterium]|nr:rod shape-determining protein MreC [Candidatus Latescibacterota bacterium]
MPRLFVYLSVHRPTTALFITTSLSITLLSLSPPQQVRVTRIAMLTVLAPVQEALSFIPSFFHLRGENRLLRAELVRLQLQNAALRENSLENIRLRRLLGFKQKTAFTYLPAEVIAHESGRLMNAIMIDIGSRVGVAPNMAVVTPEGLVGRVVEVGPISSVVQLLCDRNCQASGIVQRSRVAGIVSWENGPDFELRLPLRADVRMGDWVVSSGLGGVFPRGLIIGQVVGVSLEDMGLFRRALIAPRVDFSRLEEVFVIVAQSEPPDEQPAMPDSLRLPALRPESVGNRERSGLPTSTEPQR